MTLSGSVWNSAKIDLTNPFDFTFNVYLGCKDANGADGIVFMLQPVSTSLGTTGEGMGFQGVSPSIGITLDTWQNINLNDPAFDHICIQANGIATHGPGDLAPAIPASAASGNIEDCQWHTFRIKWNPGNDSLTTYFDGVFREGVQQDIINSIFNGDPKVYWGFSGATGGASNVQQFCTALNPAFAANISNNAACAPANIQFSDQSVSFAPITSYVWDFGNGNTSTSATPLQTYNQPGIYPVKLTVTGLDGCTNDTTTTIIVGSQPSAQMSITDACYKDAPNITFSTNNVGVTYSWIMDGTDISGQQQAIYHLNPGTHQMQLVVASQYNCGVPDTATQSFTIKPLPHLNISTAQQCNVVNFSGIQLDNQTNITQWNWDFGDNYGAIIQNPSHSYSAQGQYPAKLWATANNGCNSDTIMKTIVIPAAHAFAGNDTAVIKDRPFQLNAQGNGTFQWNPAIGLSNPNIANPVATLPADQQYVLTVETPEGCVAQDSIIIKVFVGPTIYVPSAFTPNGDGLNDMLRPVYVGMKELQRFAVYNRWGQLVFETSDMGKGWDGKTNQQPMPTGVYVWFIKAVDELNETVIMKGTVTIIH